MKKYTDMDEKEYNEAFKRAKELHEAGNALTKQQMEIVFPQLAESEDERIRKLLVWQVHRNIEDETNDLAGSVYDGVKGHDPDLEESIEDWKKCLAWLEKQDVFSHGEGYYYRYGDGTFIYMGDPVLEARQEEQKVINEYNNWLSYLEKQKEPHYTKRNALFDKCVENCDPKVMMEVSDEIDTELQKEQKPKPYFYCKYGGTIPLCSECKRNHYNSSFKTEEITTWYTPSNGTKHCIDYIQKEQKPIQTDVEKEYVRTLKSLISDFVRANNYTERGYYQQIYDWLDGRHIEQKSNIELIQRSWYMEGYHDGKFGNEPKWVIKTGDGGPKYEENPKYGQMLEAEQKPAISREEILHQLFQNGSIKLSDYLYLTGEQKPEEKQDYSGLTELERAIHRGFLAAGVVNVPVNIIKETAQECLAQMKPAELETLGKPMTHEEWAEDYWEHHKFASPNGNDKCDAIKFEHKAFIDFCMAYCVDQKPQDRLVLRDTFGYEKGRQVGQREGVEMVLKTPESYGLYKPAEWSEEDEDNLHRVIRVLEDNDSDWKELSDWLKSLRPSWKPSEEQMYSLGTVVKGAGEATEGSISYHLKELYEQLKKLK